MLLLVWAIFSLILPVLADEHNHIYEDDEQVVVWVNSVGPFDNRAEQYDYFQMPYCAGENKVKHHHESLAEALLGINLENSGIDIGFKKPVNSATICRKTLSEKDLNIFRYAIGQNYYYGMHIDDLRIHDHVGERDDGKEPWLYTRRHFKIQYNGNQIISVKIESDKLIPLPSDASNLEVEFIYSVTWKPTTEKFESRFVKNDLFFQHKIHWFSIFNSFMMVVFLLGLVAVVLLRTLKRDLARYDKEQSLLEIERDLADEYGWKQVHGDVFRPPSHLTLLSAFLGTGLQLGCLVFSVVLYAILGEIHVEFVFGQAKI
ncbi:hypothetical protein HDU97_003857 [Phlyctochytrium planicorne]|nr:hypothetical protein HDU97_003857 [Phlyctochytrium planicorne]